MINAETLLPHHRMSHVLKALLQAKLLLTRKSLTFLTLQRKASERQLLLMVSARARLRASLCGRIETAFFTAECCAAGSSSHAC